MKTQLYTSYLWGLNYKPFGTGGFGTQTKYVLNVFMATADYTNPVFQKYAEKIAQHAQVKLHRGMTADNIAGYGLNVDTPDDRRHVFEQIGNLAPSFSRAMSESKLGRWFSWNECCDESLGEFWPANMLLEHHLDLPDEADPGVSGLQFDDLDAAAKAKTPRAQLAALEAASGSRTN